MDGDSNEDCSSGVLNGEKLPKEMCELMKCGNLTEKVRQFGPFCANICLNSLILVMEMCATARRTTTEAVVRDSHSFINQVSTAFVRPTCRTGCICIEDFLKELIEVILENCPIL